MRSVILVLAALMAGCAQSDKQKKGETPVVAENPSLFERLRIHKREHDQEKAAKDTTPETTVDGVVVR